MVLHAGRQTFDSGDTNVHTLEYCWRQQRHFLRNAVVGALVGGGCCCVCGLLCVLCVMCVCGVCTACVLRVCCVCAVRVLRVRYVSVRSVRRVLRVWSWNREGGEGG
jgi:hypothetical protein